MRLLFWPDLPAPKEEVEPKVQKQMEMFRAPEVTEAEDKGGEDDESGEE